MDEENYIRRYSPRIRNSDEIQALTGPGRFVAPDLSVEMKIKMKMEHKKVVPLGVVPREQIRDFIRSSGERLVKLYEDDK